MVTNNYLHKEEFLITFIMYFLHILNLYSRKIINNSTVKVPVDFYITLSSSYLLHYHRLFKFSRDTLVIYYSIYSNNTILNINYLCPNN